MEMSLTHYQPEIYLSKLFYHNFRNQNPSISKIPTISSQTFLVFRDFHSFLHLQKGIYMDAHKNSFTNIDEYIALFPEKIQELLRQIRTTIQSAAPEATEKISYQMPTFFFNGNLVHFAAFKNHIGFYPAPSGIESFKNELSLYEGSKGAIRFPMDKPLPLDLIKRIVEYRVKENLKKSALKSKANPRNQSKEGK